MSRLGLYMSCAAAIALPLSLMSCVGIDETWEAMNRYTNQLLAFPEAHVLRVPLPGDAARDYGALDADLVRWHAELAAVHERISSMAIVGQISGSDLGLEFHFSRQAGAEHRALKHAFYVRRDATLLGYLAASVLPYVSRSVPLSLLVLVLNVFDLGMCLRLKALSDALSKAVDQLQGAQQALLALPLEGGMVALQQQAVCLAKLRAMAELWSDTQFGFSIVLPSLGSLSVSVVLMGSLAVATTARCCHRVVKGLRHHHHHHRRLAHGDHSHSDTERKKQ